VHSVFTVESKAHVETSHRKLKLTHDFEDKLEFHVEGQTVKVRETIKQRLKLEQFVDDNLETEFRHALNGNIQSEPFLACNFIFLDIGGFGFRGRGRRGRRGRRS